MANLASYVPAAVIFLFSFTSGAESKTKYEVEVVPQKPHVGTVNTMAPSLDGRYIITGSSDGAVKVWEKRSGRLLRTLLGHGEELEYVIFAPDSRTALSADSRKVVIWDAASGRTKQVITLQENTDQRDTDSDPPKELYNRRIFFTNDSQRIILEDRTSIKVFAITQNEAIRSREATGKEIRLIAFDAENGRALIQDANHILTWDTRSGNILSKWQLPNPKSQYDGVLHHDGTGYVASKNTIYKIDLRRKEIKKWMRFKSHAESVSFSYDLRHALVVAGRQVHLVSLAKRKFQKSIDRTEFEASITAAFFKGSPFFYVITSRSSVEIYDANASKRLRNIELEDFNNVFKINQLELVKDANQVLILSNSTGYRPVTTYSELLSWDLEPNGLVQKLDIHTSGGTLAIAPTYGSGNDVAEISISPNEKRLYTIDSQNVVQVWDTETGRRQKVVHYQGYGIYFKGKVFFKPDGTPLQVSRRMAGRAYGYEPGLTVANVDKMPNIEISSTDASDEDDEYASEDEKFEPNKSFPFTDRKGYDTTGEFVSCAELSGTGQFLASHSDGLLSVWNVDSGQRRYGVKIHDVLNCGFVPGGDRVWVQLEGRLEILSSDLKSRAKTLRGATGRISWSDDGSTMVSYNPDVDPTLKLWKPSRSTVFSGISLSKETKEVTSFALSSRGQQLLIASRRRVILLNTNDSSIVVELGNHSQTVHSTAFFPNGTRAATGDVSGVTKIWDLQRGELLGTFFGGKSWLTQTETGFFVSGRKKRPNILNVIRGMEVFGIDQFYQALYRPDLVQEKLAGDPQGKVKEAAERLDLNAVIASGSAPEVEILTPQDGGQLDTKSVVVKAKLTAHDGGIGKVEWRINGVSQGVTFRPKIDPQTGLIQETFELGAETNTIEVVAYNRKNLIASPPANVTVKLARAVRLDLPNLHVLTVGVNDYWDSSLRLEFAVNDAEKLGEALEKAGAGLYRKIVVTRVREQEVTKANLEKVFTELSTKVRATDVFVFFVSGHGKTFDGRYYFLPQDFRYSGPDSWTAHGIGQKTLQTWFANIKAQKSVLIFDTCESGSLKELAAKSVEDLAAIDKLKAATGRTTLMAASSQSIAIEGFGGHGIFTYALLEAIATADTDGGQLIEITELMNHIDRRVPEISYSNFQYRQVPLFGWDGKNYALVKQLPEVRPQPDPGATSSISKKTTHVVIRPAKVYASTKGVGAVVRTLDPGTLVTLVETSGGWALVAKDGNKLGYVADDGRLAAQQ